MVRILRPTLLALLSLAVLAGSHWPDGWSGSEAAAGPSMGIATSADPGPSPLRVAGINAREGSFLTPRADKRDATDRRRLARRLLGRPGAMPDVVLVQEAFGHLGAIARELSARPRAQQQGVRYAAVTSTGMPMVTGSCHGRRAGPFRLLRSSGILVNRKTVRVVHARGAVRTWGRWHRPAWKHTGRQGHGCTAHPWVRLSVRQAGYAPRQALVTSAHVAPVGRQLKTRAVRVLRAALDRRHAAHPHAHVVLGGDLNLNRCARPLREGERRHCTPERRIADWRPRATGTPYAHSTRRDPTG